MEAKFTYVGIRVKDMDTSVGFYTRVLDMKEVGRSRIEQTKGDVASLQSADGSFTLELNHYDADSPYSTKYVVGEGLDHLAFGVSSLDEALRHAKEAGHPVVHQVRTGKSRWAYVEDPNGIWVELFEG